MSSPTKPWPYSLRAQFALVTGLLTFTPTVMVSAVFIWVYQVPLAWGLLLPIVLLALLTGGMGLVFSRRMLEPLSKLSLELTTQGMGDAQPDDPAEVRRLRGAFGGLLSRLRTERERRSAFMATLVHDLKTPLIASSHLVTLLQGGALPTAEHGLIYTELLEENRRLLQLADAHRFEREDVQLITAPTDLRSLAERLAVRQAQAHPALRVEVQGAGLAQADLQVLERALLNLLDNAARYARGRLRLEVLPAELRVLDDGPGLASPLSQLAQPFNAQPVEIAGHHYTAGTAGLGLFIARRVAEAHGGALSYRREGEWSVFGLTLGEPALAVAEGVPA